MSLAEIKRAWFLERRAELHARGLKDSHIAEQMGYKPSYFSQIVTGSNVGDGFIDKMCSAFGFRFTAGEGVQQSAKVQPTDATMQRVLKAVEEQGTLLRTLAELVLARKGT